MGHASEYQKLSLLETEPRHPELGKALQVLPDAIWYLVLTPGKSSPTEMYQETHH